MTTDRKPMARADFTKAVKSFTSATNSSIKYARICAEAALVHFEAHGDVVYIQEFLDAMPKNYIRKAAFLAWCRDHSPLTMTDDGKLSKDKSEDAVKFDLDGAFLKDFWEYAPDKEETVFFNETDIVKSLTKAIARFAGKKYQPKSPTAKLNLARAEKLIKEYSDTTQVGVAPNEPEDVPGQPEETPVDDHAPTDSDALNSRPAIEDAPDQVESAAQAAETLLKAADAA